MKRKLWILALFTFIGVPLDQLTKLWAIQFEGQPPQVVVDGFWNFIYVENKGAAWSTFAGFPDAIRIPFFVVLSAVASVFILYFLRQIDAKHTRLLVALSSVFSGAVGNFIDRLIRGSVIDFVDWHLGQTHWPTFNVADIFITGGIILLAWEIFFGESEISFKQARLEKAQADKKKD